MLTIPAISLDTIINDVMGLMYHSKEMSAQMQGCVRRRLSGLYLLIQVATPSLLPWPGLLAHLESLSVHEC